MTGGERAAVLAHIARTRAPLKIVLKTRDDPYFLDDWIAHHAALVGAENLVVIDNNSTDPAVLASYAGLRPRTPILRFEGYYDHVHYPGRLPDFYEALRAGCDRFLFLDTDEFLVGSDGRTLGADRALKLLREDVPGDFIPTTRLNCVELYRNRFVVGPDDVTLRRQFKWGKPIIRSASTGWPELINCNLHLRGALAPYPLSGLFILHFAHFLPDQRIRNNVNKLVACGFMKADEPLAQVIARTVPEGEWMNGIYVDELRRLLPLRGTQAPDDAPLAPGTLKVAADGTLAFASAVEESVFRGYVGRFADVVHDIIIEGRWPSA